MKRFDELLAEFCPDGVEYKPLGEVFYHFSGFTGSSNKWAEQGNGQFIDYMNVYTKPKVDVSDLKWVTLQNLNQFTLQRGDVLFTSASETPDECALSSEIEDELPPNIYLDDHLFALRTKDEYVNRVAYGYLKYAFRGIDFRLQVIKAVRGVTRYYVVKDSFLKLKIPLPPLAIQQEIVRILDGFTGLIVELEAELAARQKQYEQYREKLLTFGDDIEWKKLGEVCEYGKNRISENMVTLENYVSVETLLQDKRGRTKATSLPSSQPFIGYEPGDVLIGNIRPYLKKIWLADCTGGTNGDVLVVHIRANEPLDNRYLYYVLASDKFFLYATGNTKSGKMPRGDKTAIMKYLIPLPPLNEQRRIVEILDKFDGLCNGETAGLRAEIAARRKQYEYYRERLLTFKKKAS